MADRREFSKPIKAEIKARSGGKCEEWRPVQGFVGVYEVSSLGRVHSLDRVIEDAKLGQKRIKGRMLRLSRHTGGYMQCSLASGGRTRKAKVHRLVANAFLRMPRGNVVVCHINGDPADNRVGNLRWATQSQNMKDRVRHGTSNRGENHGASKLTAKQVRYIRANCDKRGAQRRLAKELGVTFQTINDIVRGRRWAWM